MSQLERYNQGGIGRRYWDFRDRAVMRHLGERPIIDVGCGEMITTKKMGAWGVDIEGPGLPGSAYDFPHDRTFKLAWALTGMWSEIGRDRGHVKQWTPGLGEYILLQSGFYIVDHESIPVNCWPLALHHIVVAEKL